MARSLLVVPPLLKYAAGPLLGPAMLRGAAEGHVHEVQVMDLGFRWSRDVVDEDDIEDPQSLRTPFLGDHAKPPRLLDQSQTDFVRLLDEAIPGAARERTA